MNMRLLNIGAKRLRIFPSFLVTFISTGRNTSTFFPVRKSLIFRVVASWVYAIRMGYHAIVSFWEETTVGGHPVSETLSIVA